MGWQSRCSTTAVYDRHVILNFIAIMYNWRTILGYVLQLWSAFCGLLQLQNNVFDRCNQTMIDGWEGHGELCNPLAQGATAKSKEEAPTKHSDNPVGGVCKMCDFKIAMHRWRLALQSAVKVHAGGCCANACWTSNAQYCRDGAVQSPKVSNFGSELMKRWGQFSHMIS